MTFSDVKSEPAIRSVTLNGKKGARDIVRPWVAALNNPSIVTEKAGFLFKAAVRNDHLLLAAVPVLIDGERSHHYDQHLDGEDAYTLLGDINAAGVFTILFKPESLPLQPEQTRRYLGSIRAFASWLLAEGYTGEGLLSEVTRNILGELGLSPTPRTLADLAV